MKTHKLLSVLVVSYMCTCNGHVIDDSPPKSLKKYQVPLQRISDTRRDVHIPPLAFLNKHSDLQGGFRDGGIPSFPEEETGRVHSIPEEETGRVHSIPDAKSEGLNNLEDARSNLDSKPTIQDHSQRLSEAEREIGELVEDPVALNILRTYWTDLRSQMPDNNLDESKGKTPLWWRLILMGLGGLYLPSRDESIVNNSQCIKDVELIYNPVGESQWGSAAVLIDSWGKMPDGLFAGNTFGMGSFDECLFVTFPRDSSGEKHPQGNFKGQYCSVVYTMKKQEETPDDPEDVLPRLAPFMASADAEFLSYYSYGTCIPSSCTEEDFIVSLTEVLNGINKTVGSVSCQIEDSPAVDFTPGLIAMITLLSLFGCLLLGGAAVNICIQYTGKEELRKGPLKYLLVFSFHTNLEKMFHINTSENKEAITCLYGMRVMSMTWVVWCHQYALTIMVNGNKSFITDIFNGHWMIQIIANGFLSVDSFFFMSGLLVAYGVIKEKERSGSFNIIIFYIHRCLRLSIPILLLSGFLATFTQYLAHGPFAGTADDPNSLQDACQKYWWRDALLISNFFPPRTTKITCLDVCWYTGVDFQLYLVAPIILFPFIWGDLMKISSRQKFNVGYIWLGIMTLASALIPGIITVVNKLPPTSAIATPDFDLSFEQNVLIYMKPWSRAQPYVIGMWLGILLRRDSKREIRLQMWQVICGWLVAAGTGLAVVFGMYDYNQFGSYPGYHWAESFFYASFHRLAWGCALAWVVFACHYGYGGPVNTFLSHPSWQPLSRLTYCIFLVAIPVQQILYNYNNYFPLYYSHLNKALETVSALFVAGIGAVLLSLCAEAPVMGLEKLLLRRGSPKKT